MVPRAPRRDPRLRQRGKTTREAFLARFGFPFIMAVRDRRPEEVLAASGSRLGNAAAEEQQEAQRQVEHIPLLRPRDRF